MVRRNPCFVVALLGAILLPRLTFAMQTPRAGAGSDMTVQPWQKEVVYQIYPRSFADGNGDGIGDLRGILHHVDYLKSLGVTMVWLCPVNRTTNYDNGYDVSDYLEIDATFGTLADWEALRDALQARGIKIMMDLVLNHTSDAHPWFVHEIRLKNLRQQLPPKPPEGWTHPPALFAEAMRAVLRQEPMPAGVSAQDEPFSTLISAVAEHKKASEHAASLGYPAPAQQLEAAARELYGTPEERATAAQQADDFYIWRPEPNNWTSIFSGSAWHYVQSTGAYYLALFSMHQPDLNWHNPRVRRVMASIMRTWLRRGVDGFRLDSVGFVAKDQRFLDAPPTDTSRMGRGMQYFVNQAEVHQYLRALKTHTLRDPPARTVGEISFSPVEMALEYAGYDRQELTEVFLFDHMYVDIKKDKFHAVPLHLPELKRVLGRQQSLLHNRAWVGNYLENHDQLRAVSRFGDDGRYRVESAAMLGTLLFCLEGTPYIYQGQEIGMTNGRFARIEEVDDIEARNYYATAIHAGESPTAVMANVSARNRDNVRTVMQWNGEAFAGFSKHQPWTKVNANFKAINVAQAEIDPNSVLAYYKKLIKLRREQDVMAIGEYLDLLPLHEHLYVFTRELGPKKILVALNFSGQSQKVPVSHTVIADRPHLLLGNYAVDKDELKQPDLILRPWEARIYSNF